MNSLNALFPENLYHSYIIEGDPDTTVFDLRDFLVSRGEINENNQDILCQVYDSFTINDSRMINEWHSKKRIDSYKKICIIGAKFINNEAEKALLKVIEEPQAETHFFIVVPNSQILLDTILSRSHIVRIHSKSNIISDKIAENFYKSSKINRIEIISKIIKEHDDDKNSGSLRFIATELVNNLEKIIYNKFENDKLNKNIQFILLELNKAREYLSIPGSSTKMILEHISLVL
ncbi:MAG: hypothetical protein KGI58_03030 [Patescibacteria group bacterium]|nr:hypothetical protein [Patescibacteria group bacterium]